MTETESSLDARLTEEVSLLSTRLVNAVLKQLELEEIVHHLRKENSQLKTKYESLQQVEQKYNELLPQFSQKSQELVESKKIQAEVEAKNNELNSEVEDLTASLFDEANKMVSDASRETYNFKLKNGKLMEELQEKDSIIQSLQLQLTDLKDILGELQDENSHSNQNQNRNLDSGNAELHQDDAINHTIYSPTIKSIRLDLNNYNHEFKGFIYALIKPDFLFELSNLKNYRFFKKVWNDEIENALTSVPAISQNALFKNFQRGKNFWSSIVEGRAVIEPVKGTNESFRLSYKGEASEGTSPVAVQDPCSTCGEARNDMLEHARLYYFKLLTDLDSYEVIASFPLCNYCVIKLRNICDFFAKLRLIKKNIYKLTPNSSFDEFAMINQFGQFKINSSSNGQEYVSSSLINSNKKRIILDINEEAKLMKIYILLIFIRNKIFWSKMGIWDNFDETTEINIDEMKLQTFINHAQTIQPEAVSATQSQRSSANFLREAKSNDSLAVPEESPLSREQTKNASPAISSQPVLGSATEKIQETTPATEPVSQAKDTQIETEKVDQVKKEPEHVQTTKQDTQVTEQEISQEKQSVIEDPVVKQEEIVKEELTSEEPIAEKAPIAEQEPIEQTKEEPRAEEQPAVKEGPIIEKQEVDDAPKISDAEQAKIDKKKELARKREAMKAKLAAENNAEAENKPKSRLLNSNTKSKVSQMIKKVEDQSHDEGSNNENEDEFVDASEHNHGGLTRKKSKSKQFTKKMNEGLDETLDMLRESIVE